MRDVVNSRDGGKRVTVHFAPTSGDYTDPSGWTMTMLAHDMDDDLDVVLSDRNGDANLRGAR